jgi:acetyl esterase/lipase
MRSRLIVVLILALAGALSAQPQQRSVDAAQQPRIYVYREIDGQKLNAHVFLPPGEGPGTPTSAILLFHGGGWNEGSAEWTFGDARRFAALGLVAVAVDYRLSKGNITPIEALDDTRTAFRWVRRHAAELGIDPNRVAGHGVSAGGQLVAAAATIDFPDDKIEMTSSKPNLLLLWSPALDIAADGWFVRLLQGRAKASDHSPLEHAGASTPPTSIVNGDKDTLTPLAKAERFRDLVVQAGGVCELNVYPGVGHLLTRNLLNQESDFDPHPEFRADGKARQERFLRERGYISEKAN